MAAEALEDFLDGQFIVELQFRDLLAADDAQRQRKGEHQARVRVEAVRAVDREGGTAQQALEAAQQVVVAEEAQVVGLLACAALCQALLGSAKYTLAR